MQYKVQIVVRLVCDHLKIPVATKKLLLPVTSSLIVSNSTSPPSTVSYYCILHRTLVVDPAEKLWGLPVLHRVMSAGSISSTISPEYLRLHKFINELNAIILCTMSEIINCKFSFIPRYSTKAFTQCMYITNNN